MLRHRKECGGWLAPLAIYGMFISFMVVSLIITAAGTGRFSQAMGFGERTGWAVGAVLDFAKEVLPLAIMTLLQKRAGLTGAVLAIAWLGLATYSCLVTGATVSMAIAEIERHGTWQMQVRSGTESELASIEQQITALAEPKIPRPAKAVREALATEAVPAAIWRDSRECLSIRDSNYFQKACRRVLELRRELTSAEEYERLDNRVRELRERLAGSPVIAVSDPLPEAFETSLGRLVPLDGRSGVALILTTVVEIMSTLGFAALRIMRNQTGMTRQIEKGALTHHPIRDIPQGEKTSYRGLPREEQAVEITGGIVGARRQGGHRASGPGRPGTPQELVTVCPSGSDIRE